MTKNSQTPDLTITHHFLPRVPSNWCEASTKKSRSTTSWPIFECSFSISAVLTAGPGSLPHSLNADVIFSSAARFYVLIWPECTPYFLDRSPSINSSRIATSATRALNSWEWFFLFIMSDRLSSQSIYLNKWSEIPRLPLYVKNTLSVGVQKPLGFRTQGCIN